MVSRLIFIYASFLPKVVGWQNIENLKILVWAVESCKHLRQLTWFVWCYDLLSIKTYKKWCHTLYIGLKISALPWTRTLLEVDWQILIYSVTKQIVWRFLLKLWNQEPYFIKNEIRYEKVTSWNQAVLISPLKFSHFETKASLPKHGFKFWPI